MRAGMAVPQYRYARMAVKYGPAAARAAGRIARFAYKRYRSKRSGYRRSKKARFSTTQVGNRVGTSNSKSRIQLNTDPDAKSSRTLNVVALTSITLGQGLSQRERGVANIRGFKICMAVRNQLLDPLYFNAAVVSPKNTTSITPANFFRGNGTAERGIDFDNARTALEFHCLNLNTDKFVILKHKRYRLRGTGNTAFTDGTGKSYMNLDWYIKLKRQLRFEGASAGPIADPVFLVYWMDNFRADANDPPVLGTASVSERHLVYFRETKH